MRTPLSRRTLLRGLGTAIALPTLEAMLPRSASAATGSPQRFIGWFVPNGMTIEDWVPRQVGANFSLTPSLVGLSSVRDRVRVLSGLDNVSIGGQHEERTRTVLSEWLGGPPSQAESVIAGRSIDQVIAEAIAGDTPFPSLALGTGKVQGCPQPSCGAWLDNVSWVDQTTPAPKDISVGSVFDRLFGAPGDRTLPLAARIRTGRSVLDAVVADADALANRLGAADKARLDAYLTSIRSIEGRLTASETAAAACGGEIPEDAEDFHVHIESMTRLIVMALQCDKTRVITYMPAVGSSFRRFPELGAEKDHHLASHESPDDLTLITRWYVQRYGDLVRQLDDATEPDGTSLLDHTFVLYFSGMSESEVHHPWNLPILLAGDGGGTPSLRGHHAFPEGTPLARFLVSLARAYGSPITQFGQFGDSPLLDLLT